MGRDHFYNREWTQVSVIQLLRWTLRLDVSGIQPNRVSRLETRDGKAPILRMMFVSLNGELELFVEILV